MTYQEKIGLRLMRKRRELGFTQDEAAKAIGLRDGQTLMRWENGTKDFATRFLMRLSKIYFVSPEWILNWNGAADEYDNSFEDPNRGFRRKEDF